MEMEDNGTTEIRTHLKAYSAILIFKHQIMTIDESPEHHQSLQPRRQVQIDSADTANFLQKLLELGYFHDGSESLVSQPISEPRAGEEYTLEFTQAAFAELERQRANPKSADDEECCVVLTTHEKKGDGVCSSSGSVNAIEGVITRAELAKQIVTSLDGPRFVGRASISALAEHHSVNNSAIEIAARSLSSDYRRVGSDIITQQHLDDLAATVQQMLSSSGTEGRITIADLALNVFKMPLDMCVQSLQENNRLASARIANLCLDGGRITRREVVTSQYDAERETQLESILAEATQPTHCQPIIQKLQWDMDAASDCIQTLCAKGKLRGELKGEKYVPTAYVEEQRRKVDDYFTANGYVTADLLASLGVPTGDMASYVKESFPEATVVSDRTMIDREAIIEPLETLIQEVIAARSFLDLGTAIPDAILSNENDMARMLEDLLPEKLGNVKEFMGGVSITSHGKVLYISKGMSIDIEKILLRLITECSKTRAKELVDAQEVPSNNTSEEGAVITTGAKLKKAGKRGTKKIGRNEGEFVDSPGFVPLEILAERVALNYPELAKLQEEYNCSTGRTLSWETEDNDADADGGGPIYTLCRQQLYCSKYVTKFSKAVLAERQKLESTRKTGTMKAASIEESFELRFNDACHLLQLLAKIPRSFEKEEEELISTLERDFLIGFGTNFLHMLTEYALYKYQVEAIFVFEPQDAPSDTSTGAPEDLIDNNGLPPFCNAIGVTARFFDHIYLTCPPDSTGKDRDPLPLLREVLPGSVGIDLARLWITCGGECYKGGKKLGDDGQEFVRPRNFDEFIRLTEDSCLTICGLPFKMLDKKREKAILFARVKALTVQLESSFDGKVVLELAVMLLFQRIKKLVVAGDELTKCLLVLLCKERKIPESAKNYFLKLHNSLEDGILKLDEEEVAAIKEIGLNRGIK